MYVKATGNSRSEIKKIPPPPPHEIPENSRFPWRVSRGPQSLQKCGILMGDKSDDIGIEYIK